MLSKDSIQDIYSLSPMQEGMLFHYLFDKESTAYIEQLVIGVHGDLNFSLLASSFDLLIHKYDVFRTIFSYTNSVKPRQIVLKERKGGARFIDLSSFSSDKTTEMLDAHKKDDIATGFDLSKDLLIRMSVVKISPTNYHVIITFHHILIDGWCMGNLLNNLFSTYGALRNGAALNMLYEKEKHPFVNYIKWLGKQDSKAPEEFWSSYLKGYNETATVPYSKRDVEKGTYGNGYKAYCITSEEMMRYTALANNGGVTLSTIFQAAWGILLQKYNNSQDVVFGSVVSGRPPEVEGINDMMGLFINTIPVRAKGSPGTSFINLAKSIQHELAKAKPFEYFALSRIQNLVDLKNNLFDHLLVFENFPLGDNVRQKDQEKILGFEVGDTAVFEQTNYDFNCIVYPSEQTKVVFNFNTNKYDESDIRNIHMHLKSILNQAVENPQTLVSEIDMLTVHEKSQLLEQFNNTRVAYPSNETIHGVFRHQVKKFPNKTALTFEDKAYSYKALNFLSNKVANTILKYNPSPGLPVILFVDRSVEMMTGILGILKAGCAYLPVDTEYPPERINYILQDSGASLALTTQKFRNKLPFNNQVVLLDGDEVSKAAKVEVPDRGIPTSLAYIMYTSGSTGKPKGAKIMHKNVTRLVCNNNFAGLGPSTSILQTGAPVFDATTFEMWGALLNGGSLHLVDDGVILDAKSLSQAIESQKVNTMWLTAPLFNQLADQDPYTFKNLKYLLVGGDVLSPPHVNRITKLFPSLQFINGYGPTENTTFSTTFVIDREYNKSIPIGKPINNSTAYILDDQRKLQPVGAVGELYVGGEGVADGYLNREELTAERFLRIPSISQDVLYKTGDLARWLPDGNIEFLGRNDFQLKIRGFRVEPDEIVSAILQTGKVKDAFVMAMTGASSGKFLSAYVVPVDGAEIDIPTLRKDLGKSMPNYMIPSYFTVLEQLPLNTNGKVDRQLLPEPEVIKVAFEAPRDAVEQKIADVWKEVLEIDDIGISDNFFDLGGDSIKAIPITSRLKKQSINVDVRDIFQYQTIKELSAFLEINKSVPDEDGFDGDKKERLDLNDVSNEVARYFNYITDVNQAYKKCLSDAVITRKYSATGVQAGHFSVKNSTSGIPLLLQTEINKPLFLEAFTLLLREQALLRSTIHKKGFRYEWHEHAMPDSLDFPFIDLSHYEKNTQKAILKGIYDLWFRESYNVEDRLLYKMAVIKTGTRENLLVLNINHALYDVMTLKVLPNLLLTNIHYLRKGEVLPSVDARPYSEYAEQLRQGPTGLNARELISRYNLKLYHAEKTKLNKELKQKEKELNTISCLNYRLPLENIDDERALDVSYYVFALLMKRYFNMQKIPIHMFSFGRHYQNRKYYNTIGEFIDIIPLLVDVDEDHPGEMIHYARERLQYPIEHNLNFINLCTTPKFLLKWGKAIRLFAPTRSRGGILSLVFNFQGEQSEMDIEAFEKNMEEKIREGTAQNTFFSLMTEVKYTGQFIHMSFVSKFEKDMDVFKKILDELQPRVNEIFSEVKKKADKKEVKGSVSSDVAIAIVEG